MPGPSSIPLWRGSVYCLAPLMPLLRGMLTGLEEFLKSVGMSGARPCVRAHLKKGLVPHSSGRWDEQQIPTSSQQSNLAAFGRTLLPAVLTHLFGRYVLFIQYTFSIYFLSFCVFFFWSLTDHNIFYPGLGDLFILILLLLL